MANSLIGLLITALVLTGSLRDCASMTRFNQESYDCSAVSAPFSRIDFSDTDVGKQGTVEGGTPAKVTIATSDDNQITATWGDGTVRINRQTGAVTTTLRNNVKTYACKQANFRM
ncbi:hypothetical protein [Marivita sp.]|uniref:hypothetical protein n=1 Tax=Marivita sp. TaxID=2003365 RepID=UPI0025BAB4F4|nr:hypothetical protein [Marivita sp.]